MRILVTSGINDELSDEGRCSFYDDYTYRYKNWGKIQYASWKVEDECVYINSMHTISGDGSEWQHIDIEDEPDFVRMAKEAHANILFDKEVEKLLTE